MKYRLLANAIFDEVLTRHFDAYGKSIGRGHYSWLEKKEEFACFQTLRCGVFVVIEVVVVRASG